MEASHSGRVRGLGKLVNLHRFQGFESLRFRQESIKVKVMFYTYILQSETTGKYYIGQTQDIEQRLLCQNNHPDKCTKHRGPWKLTYSEEYNTRAEAMRREKQIKSYKGGNAFKALVS